MQTFSPIWSNWAFFTSKFARIFVHELQLADLVKIKYTSGGRHSGRDAATTAPPRGPRGRPGRALHGAVVWATRFRTRLLVFEYGHPFSGRPRSENGAGSPEGCAGRLPACALSRVAGRGSPEGYALSERPVFAPGHTLSRVNIGFPRVVIHIGVCYLPFAICRKAIHVAIYFQKFAIRLSSFLPFCRGHCSPSGCDTRNRVEIILIVKSTSYNSMSN